MAYGTSGQQALLDTVALAQHAESLGYTRFWVAEHHNIPALASAVPDMLMGQIAAHTTRLTGKLTRV